MTTWWLAIHRSKKRTSYQELKRRKVAAQGWPALGDLRALCALVEKADKNTFVQKVDALARTAYGNAPDPRDRQVSGIMWNLLSMGAGDLVVGIEGTTVKGICELERNGWESYQHDPGYDSEYNYAQTIGFPVEWIDWDVNVFGFTPTPPRQSVRGVKRLQNESGKVETAWKRYRERTS